MAGTINVVDDFNAVPGTDCTIEFEKAIKAAKDFGYSLEVPSADLPFDVQHLDIPSIEMFGHSGAVIRHQAPDNNTDCIHLIGEYGKPGILRNIKIEGVPGIGRDLISVRKGDQQFIQHVWMENANRNGFKAIPHGSGYWIENLDLIKCKVINPKEDSYAFEVLDNDYAEKFINCTQMIGCESRTAQRHAIRLSSFDTTDKDAKISSFSVIGGEYAVGYGADPMQPIIKLESQSNLAGGFIENVSFYNTTIEYAGEMGKPAKRTGYMLEASGLMKGILDFRASNWHGTEYFMKDFRLFPDYDIYDQIARRWFRSQQGITDEFKSNVNVKPNYDEYTGVVCKTGEIIEGYVFERYNNDKVYAKFTAINGKALICPPTSRFFMDVKMINGEIVLTNQHPTELKFEMVFQRVAFATSY